MILKDALVCLCDGHTIWTVDTAKEICLAVGVPFNKYLIHRYKSDKPGTFKGLTMKPGQENSEGVDSLSLSRNIATQLDVEKQAGDFFGRGSQARAYVKVIEEKLKTIKDAAKGGEKENLIKK